jgi:hypothetical protein
VAGIDPLPRAISRTFASRIDLAARLRLAPFHDGCASYAQGDVFRLVRSGAVLNPLEQEQALAHAFGADERFPYFDRRLVEFALRLPEPLRWSHARSKVVLRHAAAGRVPERVTRGTVIHDYSFLLVPWLRQLAPRRAEQCRVVDRGWVDGADLNRLLTRLHGAPDAAIEGEFRLLWPLWQIVATELLVEAVDRTRTVERATAIQYTDSAEDRWPANQ